MQIGMIGAGYVGLVAGTCFAEMGHKVTIVDSDPKKIDTLRAGETPFYEPGLRDLLERNIREKRLTFTTQLADAVRNVKVVFIAVQTPQSEDGSADLSNVLGVAQQIGQAMDWTAHRGKQKHRPGGHRQQSTGGDRSGHPSSG